MGNILTLEDKLKQNLTLITDNHVTFYPQHRLFFNKAPKLTEIQRKIYEEKISRINNIIAHDEQYFEKENIALPNNVALETYKNLIFELSLINISRFNMSTSIEEGICLTFQNVDNRMYLELYNDGDIAYLIENTNSGALIKSEDLSSIDQAIKLVLEFVM
ncbi:MAG: hypothetical protein U5L09_17400 [Bacteroidales bacterium]|nr:hypothetical protein [Bacteroidales bacterium]